MPEQLKEVLRGYLNEYRDLQSKVNDIDAYLALTREERESLDFKLKCSTQKVAMLFCQFENELLS